MNNEERGLYIQALCLQWTQGSISKDDLCSLGGAMAQPSLKKVLVKFVVGSDGRLRNDRMELERGKQNEFRENRSKSGKLGAKNRWHSHNTAITQPMANGMANDGSPSPSPSSSTYSHKKRASTLPETEKEAVDWASMEMVPAEFAAGIYHQCAGRNWVDGSGQEISSWRNYVKHRFTQIQRVEKKEAPKKMTQAEIEKKWLSDAL